MIQSNHVKKNRKSNIVLHVPPLLGYKYQISNKQKNNPKIIGWYICRNRKLKNTFRNSSIFLREQIFFNFFFNKSWIILYYKIIIFSHVYSSLVLLVVVFFSTLEKEKLRRRQCEILKQSWEREREREREFKHK